MPPDRSRREPGARLPSLCSTIHPPRSLRDHRHAHSGLAHWFTSWHATARQGKATARTRLTGTLIGRVERDPATTRWSSMAEQIGDLVARTLESSVAPLQQAADALRRGVVVDVAETAGGARPAFVAALWRRRGGQILSWHASIEAADRFANDAAYYLAAEGSPVGVLRPRQQSGAIVSPSERSERITFLEHLQSGVAGIYCVPHAALRQPLAELSAFAAAGLTLETGREYPWDSLIASFSTLGYERVDVVSAVGEFAVRGGLIDAFPATADFAVRMEFFGDRLEQMRTFALSTQRSLESLDTIVIAPWSETLVAASTATLFDYARHAIVVVDDAESIVAVDHGLASAQDDTTVADIDAPAADTPPAADTAQAADTALADDEVAAGTGESDLAAQEP